MSFKKYIDKENIVNEVKLLKDSMMFGGKPAVSLYISYGETSMAPKGKGLISIVLNGGSAYDFEISEEKAKELEMRPAKEKNKKAQNIAVKIAKEIEKEVGKL